MLLRIHKLYPVMEWREGPAFFEMLYDLSCKSANTEEAYNNIIISLKHTVILLNYPVMIVVVVVFISSQEKKYISHVTIFK